MTYWDGLYVSVILFLFALPLFSGLPLQGAPRIKRATHLHMRASGGRLVQCRVVETEQEDYHQ